MHPADGRLCASCRGTLPPLAPRTSICRVISSAESCGRLGARLTLASIFAFSASSAAWTGGWDRVGECGRARQGRGGAAFVPLAPLRRGSNLSGEAELPAKRHPFTTPAESARTETVSRSPCARASLSRRKFEMLPLDPSPDAIFLVAGALPARGPHPLTPAAQQTTDSTQRTTRRESRHVRKQARGLSGRELPPHLPNDSLSRLVRAPR